MAKIKELHRRWSKAREYRAAYDALDEEFELAKALIEARTRAGLSQTQLARRMKTSQSYVVPHRLEERLQGGRQSGRAGPRHAPIGRSDVERAGVPPSVGMSIVGHKTESIYRRYAIVNKTMQREEAARLDAWMAAPPAAPSTATVTALRRGRRLRGHVTG